MKVKELLEALAETDPEAEVILQKDAEGNGYSPLEGVASNAVYIPDTIYSGSVYSLDWSADDAAVDEDEWNTIKAKPRCAVLFPVN